MIIRFVLDISWVMNNENMQKLAKLCRAAGLKITPQRQAVYDVLVNSREHPTAESVYKEVRGKLPHISLDTVNRTLLTLDKIGAAFVVEGSGMPRRFDANFVPHQHFRCMICNRVFDVYNEEYNHIKLPESISSRFTVLRKTVYLEGICRECKLKHGDKINHVR